MWLTITEHQLDPAFNDKRQIGGEQAEQQIAAAQRWLDHEAFADHDPLGRYFGQETVSGHIARYGAR